MKSPFPGMDPYIEDCGLFEDFHQKLIGELEREISHRVPNQYTVRTGERNYLVLAQDGGKKEHAFLPDVGIAGPRSIAETRPGAALVGLAVESETVEMRAFITTEFRESFIEIYTTEPERDLVTCIEVLSPSNKRRKSRGWKIYQRKRRGILIGTAHLVEIDLLRGGARMPMIDPWPNSPYSYLVARKLFAPNCRVQPAHFRIPLPVLRIPLVHPDPDVMLDLQPMVDAIYARSKYARDIDYAKPLSQPLTAEDAAWLAEQLKQHAPTLDK